MLGIEPGVETLADEAPADEIARDEIGRTDGAGIANRQGPAFDGFEGSPDTSGLGEKGGCLSAFGARTKFNRRSRGKDIGCKEGVAAWLKKNYSLDDPESSP